MNATADAADTHKASLFAVFGFVSDPRSHFPNRNLMAITFLSEQPLVCSHIYDGMSYLYKVHYMLTRSLVASASGSHWRVTVINIIFIQHVLTCIARLSHRYVIRAYRCDS